MRDDLVILAGAKPDEIKALRDVYRDRWLFSAAMGFLGVAGLISTMLLLYLTVGC